MFSRVGGVVAIRAPRDDPEILAALRRARATWDKGTKQWWIRADRAERLVADLRVVVDPLFRGVR
jgi:hypothetical protein